MKLIIEIPKTEYECAKQRWMIANDAYKREYYNPQWMEETATHKMDGYISNGIPLNDVKTEIGKCKTQKEMQLSEKDTKGKLMISDIFCHIIEILDNISKNEE